MTVQLDLAAFWQENAQCVGKPFRTDKPRAPIALPVDDHWLLDEMKLPSTIRYYRDPEYRARINRQCNDRCEAAIGLRPFAETVQPPAPMRIEEVFGCRIELTENTTPWLEPAVRSPEELRAMLDRIERMDDAELRGLILSTGATIAREPREGDGSRRKVVRFSRGPATIGTSVLGTTELMWAIIDEPALMERFYELLADVLVRYQRILADEADVEVRGYGWLDDNCALFSPELYARFCLPVMRKVFAALAPGASDFRFQHSDSAMAHLLPILATLDLKGCNFGPTIPAAEIRRHMPRTQIHGQVAPMTLRNGSPEAIEAEVRRDFQAVGSDGGLLLTTAGSISAGTTLERIRWFMHCVQRWTRYDR
jgi:uroporphyrinogen decarboxylase